MIIIILELATAHCSISLASRRALVQDAQRWRGGRRFDGNSLNPTLIKSASNWQPEALQYHHQHYYYIWSKVDTYALSVSPKTLAELLPLGQTDKVRSFRSE